MKTKSKFAAAGLGIAAVALAFALPTQSQAQDGDLAIGRTLEGELTTGDSVDGDKQYYDEFRLRADPGAQVSLLLSSDDFDTELRIAMPDGTTLSNDDDHVASETTNSRLDIVMPAEGVVRVRARSFRAAATGSYQLGAVSTDSLAIEADAPEAASIGIGQTREGELAESDYQNARGRHVDYYEFEGTAGQRLDLHLNSRGFDTVLALEGADGFVVRNDDDATAGEQTLNSRVVATLPEAGTYRILVTSYGTGETGAYTLATAINRNGDADTEQTAGNAEPLQFGQAITAELGKDDDTLATGEYLQRYSFEGHRGQPVTIDLSSEDFDTYLILRSPGGEQEDIDDTGDSLNSRYERVLAEDGLYTVTATSYAPGATGAFRLALSEGTTRIPAEPEARQVFAITVGIADYGGNSSNLTNTDTDAAKLYRKLEELGVLHEESILLTNQDASIDEFRTAFRRVAAQAGPDDIFLFFFSGHGNQIEDATDTGELDRRDETLVFADGEELTDDELARMFAEVHAGTAMIVLDSCFSGGFERDVITRPGMMGLFSSEEDLTSLVASEFSAGGYLARFFSDAVGGQADDNGDHNVTAGELVSYIRYRFREQCNGRNCIEAETGDAQRNHQELVVQRGSVQVDDILVVLPEQYGVVRGTR
ncbi:pre-peptidase C-terminal domain-containing protein [Parasphingopyxis marina]|uniref:Caspase family protein n=1 Tax=Parasphingopyxis marina TaxID=2761622 RepID=A0A842I322_9SPHN|nr:pre-peptidase C-terminal domain-containing protein [Parasphingopyxis marina]MBC2778720.1 caspase family protein [Parasphingopyxis marina]